MQKSRWWLAAALAAGVFGANFWGTSIYVLDEAKNAACAMEMLQRGDWIVPTFNGELRTDKPPLHYYFMMLSYRIFGINPFAARLFSVLAGVALVVVVYHYVRKFLSERVAFLTSLLLASSLQLAVQFHLAVPDPYLILLMVGSLFLLYDGLVSGGASKMIGFYVLAALGFLTKGLIAVVFPAAIAAVFLVATGRFNRKQLGALRLGVGIPVFLLIALPWYWAVHDATGGVWTEQFFLKHNVGRFTSTMEGHRGFFLAPFAVVVAALLPMSAFVIQASRFAWKRFRTMPFLLYCFIAAAFIPLFFSFSKTILPNYPAPAIPFLAVLLAFYTDERMFKAQHRKKGVLFSLSIYLLLSLAVPIGVYLALNEEAALSGLDHLSYPFLLLPLAGVAAIYLYLAGRPGHCVYTLLGSWMATSLLFFCHSYPQVDRLNPVTASLAQCRPDSVAAFGGFNPAYVMALKRTLTVLSTPGDVVKFLQHPGTAVISQKKYWGELETTGLRIVFERKDLFENPTTIVVRSRADSCYEAAALPSYLKDSKNTILPMAARLADPPCSPSYAGTSTPAFATVRR